MQEGLNPQRAEVYADGTLFKADWQEDSSDGVECLACFRFHREIRLASSDCPPLLPLAASEVLFLSFSAGPLCPCAVLRM